MVTAATKKVSPVVAGVEKKVVAPKKTPVKPAVVAVRKKAISKTAAEVKVAAIATVKAPARAKLAAKLPEVKPASEVVVEKVKKAKLVRDSFTMPESEYAALGAVKKACLKAGVEVKKSQLLRIGVALLSKTDVPALKKLIAGLAPLKAGRPKKEK